MALINLVYETVMTDKGDKLYLSKQMPILMEMSQKINDLAFSSVFLFLKKKKLKSMILRSYRRSILDVIDSDAPIKVKWKGILEDGTVFENRLIFL